MKAWCAPRDPDVEGHSPVPGGAIRMESWVSERMQQVKEGAMPLSERWMYGSIDALLNRGWALVGAAGLWPKRLVTLEVRGRRSGRLISLPLIVADYEGERYLVSNLGEGANWLSNVRAAGGQAVLRHGRRESVRLEEVEPHARAPILRRYLQVAPAARKLIPVDRRARLTEFERIAVRYPVLRVVAVSQQRRSASLVGVTSPRTRHPRPGTALSASMRASRGPPSRSPKRCGGAHAGLLRLETIAVALWRVRGDWRHETSSRDGAAGGGRRPDDLPDGAGRVAAGGAASSRRTRATVPRATVAG